MARLSYLNSVFQFLNSTGGMSTLRDITHDATNRQSSQCNSLRGGRNSQPKQNKNNESLSSGPGRTGNEPQLSTLNSEDMPQSLGHQSVVRPSTPSFEALIRSKRSRWMVNAQRFKRSESKAGHNTTQTPDRSKNTPMSSGIPDESKVSLFARSSVPVIVDNSIADSKSRFYLQA